MRGLRLDVEQRGAGVAAHHVRELGERAADARPAFRRIGEQLERAEQAWFASSGGGEWAPLSAATQARKFGGEPLVATGRLRSSLTSSSATDADRQELRFGTDVRYARFHEFGTRHMPRRPPIVPASPRVRRMINRELRRHLLRQ